jgi:CRP-like cAMP-binding protein
MERCYLTEFPGESRYYTRGDEIFAQGEPGEHAYYLRRGQVDIVRDGVRIAGVLPGEIFGEMALLGDGLRSCAARARTNCEAVLIDDSQLRLTSTITPYFAIKIMQTMAARLRRVGEQAARLVLVEERAGTNGTAFLPTDRSPERA